MAPTNLFTTGLSSLSSGRVASTLFVCLFVLASDSANACSSREPTRQTSPGPHDFSALPAETRLWRENDAGEPLFLRARVLDTCSEPIAGARVRMLHAGPDGHHDPRRWRTTLETDERGEFTVVTVLPGYAGGMARHIHFIISHPVHRELVTRLFFRHDPAIDQSIEDLAIVLEPVERGERKGWVGGYEFVLPANSSQQ